MKPNDESGKLPLSERPFRVLLIAGSQRRQYNCPGVDSKARAAMLRMADRVPPQWEVDIEDLGNVYARARIQSCNACVSTSMALCVWPCNCYERDNIDEPDLMRTLTFIRDSIWPMPGRSSGRSTGMRPARTEADVRPTGLRQRRQPARGSDRAQKSRARDDARALCRL